MADGSTSVKQNWSLLAGLRFALAMIVAGAHTTWFKLDAVSLGFDSLGAKAAVVGFLLVSGFSIAASLERDKKSFYFRRFKRIYPVYFVAVLAGIALEVWLGHLQLPNTSFDPGGYMRALGNFFFLQTFLVKPIAFNGLVWSLAVEVSFYIAAPFLRPQRLWVWLSLIAISGAYYILPRTDGNQFYTIAMKINAIRYFWPFGMGFVLFYYRQNLITISFCAVGFAWVWQCADNEQQFATVTFLLSFIAVIYARSGGLVRSKILDYLGDISYPLYLVQLPIYILCYRLFGITEPLMLLAIAVVSACITYELIDVRLKRMIFSARPRVVLAS
jgi:peptidoglycan/LPS O-acetylase OafA/YrhL